MSKRDIGLIVFGVLLVGALIWMATSAPPANVHNQPDLVTDQSK
jgi:hypothetical protein